MQTQMWTRCRRTSPHRDPCNLCDPTEEKGDTASERFRVLPEQRATEPRSHGAKFVVVRRETACAACAAIHLLAPP
ncbi:hypothetical protein NDU88_007201 [Pleurodeles waltl]|uniref:Uncharacterized protein n=1 Tax=Pleurodeles waltl TaxID=8319 RepID=A0AAV7VRU2_PLEWA|nr:hypothetical protein NDU88_007201 [Pleurodeles waltl]